MSATRDLSDAEARRLAPGSDHRRAYVGPPDQWDFMGATQFRLLTTLGLREDDRLLDIGCGALRAGRLLIPYLAPDRYYGIEPNAWLVEDAIAREIGADMVRLKRPRFRHAEDLDPGPFGALFDMMVAQSIFSHAGPDMLGPGLQKMARSLAPGGLILLTVLPAETRPEIPLETPGWTYPGCISYAASTLDDLAGQAGLIWRALPWFHPRQRWLAFAKDPDHLPPEGSDALLSGLVLRDPRFAGAIP